MIVYNNFEWDVRAAAASMATQGVSFKEASTVFASEGVTITEGPEPGQMRAVGTSARGRVLIVVHQTGPQRIRILGATPQKNSATLQKNGATLQKTGPALNTVAATEPAPPESSAEAAATAKAGEPSTRPSGSGWTEEAYGIYWEAYTAAREAARQQGKSPREAQRIGKEAGERAAFGAGNGPPSSGAASAASSSGAKTSGAKTERASSPASGDPASAPPAEKKSSRSGTWRAAARALKVS